MRLKRTEKMALAKRLVAVALTLLQEHGHQEKMSESSGLIGCLERGPISMILTTVFSGLEGMPAPNGLDIWQHHHKVFSFWWDPPEIVRFNYGDWMNRLIPGSYVANEPVHRKSTVRNARQGSNIIINVGPPPGGLPPGPLKWMEDPKSGRLKLVSLTDNELP